MSDTSYADHAFVAEMSTQKSDEQLVIDAIECRVVAAMIFITDDDDADASVLERAYANSDDARAALLARMAEKDATIAELRKDSERIDAIEAGWRARDKKRGIEYLGPTLREALDAAIEATRTTDSEAS